MLVLTSVQLSSSLPSLQSAVPSHLQLPGTHRPSDLQVKVEPEQRIQLVSSLRSGHSEVPLHLAERGRQREPQERPASHRAGAAVSDTL